MPWMYFKIILIKAIWSWSIIFMSNISWDVPTRDFKWDVDRCAVQQQTSFYCYPPHSLESCQFLGSEKELEFSCVVPMLPSARGMLLDNIISKPKTAVECMYFKPGRLVLGTSCLCIHEFCFLLIFFKLCNFKISMHFQMELIIILRNHVAMIILDYIVMFETI